MKMPALVLLPLAVLCANGAADGERPDTIEERNKALARTFYEQLWNSNNTERYADLVADSYVVHDTGDRKGVEEPAVEQKNIADFFWQHGNMSVNYSYQIAEGDLVATRWIWQYEPKTLFGKYILGSTDVPIINVFRFSDGKIVEIWNHRHDIDTGQTLRFVIKGFLLGVLTMLFVLLLLRSRWKKQWIRQSG